MPNANYFSVQVNSNAVNFDVFAMTLYREVSSYFIYLFAQMVSGTPVNSFQVQIGATVNETVANLAAYLQNTYGSDPNLIITYSGNVINFEFVDQLDYEWMPNAGNAVDFTVFIGSTVPPIIAEEITPLSIKDISISIIDTYENEMPLIVEFPSDGACELSWNGGDNLLKEIMQSTLKFDMLVPEKDDAHFLHLLTGDENRFLVKVEAIDEDENKQLIWQGFLLPDQYREPYKTGVLFVDFEASDNLGTLKGKYFKPWYYQNKFPLTELLGMILERTGIEQPMLFKPSIIPAANFVKWEHINVSLKNYVNGKEYKDLHTILKDVLEANLLTIKSFRGYWWIEGLTRKKDLSGEMIMYDGKGRFFGNINFLKLNPVIMFEDGSASLDAVTPYKKVNYEWAVSGNKSMYSDNVVKIPTEQVYKSFNYIAGVDQTLRYTDKKFKDWNFNLNEDFIYNPNNFDQLILGIAFNMGINDYSYTEPMALQNYVECPEVIFVRPGILYSFEIEFFFAFLTSSSSGTSGQYYNNLIPWQLFLNGVEIMSNRPSFPEASKYNYLVKNDTTFLNYSSGSRFNLKTDFRVEQEGQLTLRICAPIVPELSPTRWFCEKLELKATEGYSENENISGDRNINFTRELDYTVKLGVSQDISIKNSMGLGLPYGLSYFRTVRDDLSSSFSFTTNHRFQPNTELELTYEAWELGGTMYQTLFQEGWAKSAFIKKANGDEIPFDNLWGSWLMGITKKAAFLTAYEGNPIIPKNYFAYTDFNAGDGIYIMQVRYPFENYLNRLSWKIYDGTVTNEFNKTLVSAIHNVIPETMYRLEGTAFQLIFPEDLPRFFFDGEDRNFIPTTLSLDLFNGKTRIVATEARYKEFTDIIFN